MFGWAVPSSISTWPTDSSGNCRRCSTLTARTSRPSANARHGFQKIYRWRSVTASVRWPLAIRLNAFTVTAGGRDLIPTSFRVSCWRS